MSLCIFQCSSCDWFLISWHFMALWSEKTLDMFPIFLNLLRLVLCPSMWSILENVTCVLVYSAALGWNALKIPIKPIWSSMLFKGPVSLLILCVEDLSIEVNGVLKSPTMTVFLLISLYVHEDLLYIFKCFCVGCVNVY